MSIFKLRPLAFGCFCAFVAMYLSYFLGNIFDIAIIVIGSLTLLTLIIISIVTKSDKWAKWLARTLPLCLCLVIVGTSALFSFARDEKLLEKYENITLEVTLEITDIRISKPYETVALAIMSDGETETEVILHLPDDKISTGDTITATVSFEGLADSALGYSERDYYLDKGIFLGATAGEYSVIEQGKASASQYLKSINEYLVSLVEKSVNSDTASLISAMLLGNKDTLGANVKRDFSSLGISHMLALSGLHISLIVAMTSAFLDLIRTRKKLKYIILISMILVFVAITGFSLSAIRAGLMLIIFSILSLVGYDGDGVSTLFASVFIIITLDPYAIFSVSLMLSFLAMLACICTSYFTRGVRPLYRIRPKWLRGIVYTLITSCAVMLFTLPIMAIFFDSVSVFAPIFNVIFVPILTILLYLSPFVLILGRIPFLSVIFTYPAELITKLTLTLTGEISKADFLEIPLNTVAHKIAVGIIVISLVLAIALNRRALKACACALLVGIVALGAVGAYTGIIRHAIVTVSSYDAKIADIIAVESDGEVMIIESSSPSISNSSRSIAYASRLGYSDIDLYILADYSYRVVEALDSASDSARIRKIMLPAPQGDKEKEYYDAVEQIALKKGIAFEKIPENLEFGDTCVEFMGYERLGRSTKRCIAYSVSANNSRLTYLGASTYECINYFPGNYAKASDAIIFGAYGPIYKMEYSYDMPNAEVVIFHTNAQNYCKTAIPQQIIRGTEHKIVFK